jgi:hypothetical protein
MATEIKPYRAPRTRAAVETAGDILFNAAGHVLKPFYSLTHRYKKNSYWHQRERAKRLIQACPNCKWTAQVHFHVAKSDELCREHEQYYRFSKIQYD